MRQLVDTDGNITLAKSYEPYGEVQGSEGSGISSFGFTGEWTDGNTGDVYLRARWYAPGQGRFLTKDMWEGNYEMPMSHNAWLYGYANPIKYVDPIGWYGKNVHHDLTLEVAYNVGINNCHGLLCAFVFQLAEWIAKANQHVDEGILSPDPRTGHPELHFADHSTAVRNIEAAIRVRKPYIVGAALYQVQDWYSHWNEGYRYPGSAGHGIDSLIAGWSPFKESKRAPQLIALFYINHPLAKSHLSRVYQNANLNDVSADNLIDLYLETFTKPGDRERGPFGYGFNTDHYFGFTLRDVTMKNETKDWLASFYFQFDPCTVESFIAGYSPPDDEAIYKFLLKGVILP